jgi:hypothetical protein
MPIRVLFTQCKKQPLGRVLRYLKKNYKNLLQSLSHLLNSSNAKRIGIDTGGTSASAFASKSASNAISSAAVSASYAI